MSERVSRYLVVSDQVYEDEDGERLRIAYATRTATTLAIDTKNAEALQGGRLDELPDQVRAELREAEAIVPQDGDELTTVVDRQRAAAADPSTVRYLLLPTSYCNMGCSYCGQEHRRGVLPHKHRYAVRARVLAGIQRPTTKAVDITWFGAEPMVGLAIIRDLSRSFLEAADARGINYVAKMPTNGSLLTLEKLRILLHECRLTRLEITLDGPPRIHDVHRPLKAGGGSFDKIIGVLREALDDPSLRGLHFSLRTNVDVNNQAFISEYIELMASYGCFATEQVSFYFAPVHSWSNDVSAIQLEHQTYADKEAQWLRQLTAHGFRISTLPSEPKHVVCKAVTRHAEAISSTGRIFSCTEFPLVPKAEKEEALGRVDDPALPALRPVGRFDDWHDSVERHETGCGRCTFLPTCGGACPKLWREGFWPCPSYKHNIQARFDLIAQLNGLTPVEETVYAAA